MQVISDVAGLAALHGGVFVPTMGALHAGHTALIGLARAEADRRDAAPVVVSVFVNPTQFNERADYERYPATLQDDLAACKSAGADAVFAPAAELVYPPGVEVSVPALPAVAGGVPGREPGLEDAYRPGHFAGVCQVVKRLFELVRPRAAVFGQKDWQQYRVIEAMVEQERLGVAILAGETVREPDGLAMSSRNRFLSTSPEGEGRGGLAGRGERERALSLSRALLAAREIAAAGGRAAEAERVMRQTMERAEVEVEYAAVRDARTLLPVSGEEAGERPMRALVAGRVGGTRLIDNMDWR